MRLLKEYILEKGAVINNKALKVDSFLNHQIDFKLMMAIGCEFKERFKNEKIDKILTIEASGIAIALAAAVAFEVPMVFAKKKKPLTMEDSYNTTVHSFTKNEDYNITVSKEFLSKDQNILILYDFLATGNAVLALKELCEKAGAKVAGVGIVIEKEFQGGRDLIEKQGIHLESLAIIESLENEKIVLK